MITMEPTFSPQLGPCYETHGPEIVPSGFEEAMERMADTLGSYEVHSNVPGFPGRIDIGHYDLTKYIQEEWDRLTGPAVSPTDFPRRGFLLSSKSPSHAAGRAAEEIVLAQLLWRTQLGSASAEKVYWFYDAMDEGLVRKPKGVGSDDFLVRMSDGTFLLVEVKASFRGKPDLFVKKAVRQLKATCAINSKITSAGIALIDLTRKTIRILLGPMSEIDLLEGCFRSGPDGPHVVSPDAE